MTASNLHVLRELANDITLSRVFAHIVFRFPEASRKNAVAQLQSASHLCAALPDHLREMRGHGIVRIILRDFIRP